LKNIAAFHRQRTNSSLAYEREKINREVKKASKGQGIGKTSANRESAHGAGSVAEAFLS
jgi:hypothetical protein